MTEMEQQLQDLARQVARSKAHLERLEASVAAAREEVEETWEALEGETTVDDLKRAVIAQNAWAEQERQLLSVRWVHKHDREALDTAIAVFTHMEPGMELPELAD